MGLSCRKLSLLDVLCRPFNVELQSTSLDWLQDWGVLLEFRDLDGYGICHVRTTWTGHEFFLGETQHVLSVQDMEEGVCRSESSGSDCSSPRGPKGGGTLKTCAVCLEDYRSASTNRVVCRRRESSIIVGTAAAAQMLGCAYTVCSVCCSLSDNLVPISSGCRLREMLAVPLCKCKYTCRSTDHQVLQLSVSKAGKPCMSQGGTLSLAELAM